MIYRLASLVAASTVIFLGLANAHAAQSAGITGANHFIERFPCEDGEPPNFKRYRERQLATLQMEQSAARAQKLPVRVIAEAAADKSLGTEADYFARNRQGIRCERIAYDVDGLKIRGFLWTPTTIELGQRLPIIVFNRGGTGDDSKLRPNTQFGFERFVRAGYAVIGSQYRGNDGSEGTDEIGGADVRDVVQLTQIARQLPFVDERNVFALGYSRGAMMTLSAARDGAAFNAVALVGLPADLRAPEFSRLTAQAKGDRAAALAARSAILWAEEIESPMLILQGSGDPLVSTARQTLPFATRLQELSKDYELVIYHGDSHGIAINGNDRDQRILDWFARFKTTK